MLNHDGMERYIASYLLGILYIIVAFALNDSKKKKKNLSYVIVTSIILLITPLTSVANATITSGIYNINTSFYCNMGRNRAEEIQNTVKKEEKVLGICQDKNKELINLMIRYYMYPISYEVATIQEEQELKEIVESQKYDYIYILTTDEIIESFLKDEYTIQNIEENTLFKVTNQGLEKVI